jgi:hypothetical protein
MPPGAPARLSPPRRSRAFQIREGGPLTSVTRLVLWDRGK